MLDLLFVTTVSSFSSKKSKTWKTNFKPSCHIRFPHAFSALRCVFIIITFFHRHQQTKVSNKNLTNNHTQLYCYLISFSLDKMRIGKVTFNTVFFCQAISATTSALTNSIRLKKTSLSQTIQEGFCLRQDFEKNQNWFLQNLANFILLLKCKNMNNSWTVIIRALGCVNLPTLN